MFTKSKRTKIGGVLYDPFENFLHLNSMVQFLYRGRNPGAFLNKKNDDYQFTFGFEAEGVHPTLSDEDLQTFFKAIEDGLKEILPQERFTIHFGSFASCESRLKELEKLWEETKSPTLRLLLKSEQKRVLELYKQGIRKPKFLRFYVSFTVVSESGRSDGWLDRSLAWLTQKYESVAGDPEVRSLAVEKLLEKGFSDGFLLWEQLLSTKMGFNLRALDAQDLWGTLWSRFNKSEPILVPQCIVFSDSGVSEIINSDVHPLTLLQGEVPTADPCWIRVKDQFVGVLTFAEKPGGWSSRSHQLRYLWQVMARERVTDTEIICQLGRANDGLVKSAVQRLVKQANNAVTFSGSKGNIDVAAQLKTEKAVNAHIQILEGDVPVWVGLAILVHRPTLQQLDDACRYIENCFSRPASVQREKFYAWQLWLQTLPVCWDSLLARPFNRRKLFLHSEAIGMMPLVIPSVVDKSGLELVTEEGGCPIFLDLIKELKHLMLLAITRAGKSVLVAGILTQALAAGIPVRAFDFPKPDGTSTFTDYTHANDGAYFDISTQANNLFEFPDLRALPLKLQQERHEEFVAFLESALLTMVLGKSNDPTLNTHCRSILNLALTEFFADPEIKARYDRALDGGVGSEAWANIPTLNDFFPFCNAETLDIKAEGDVRQAFEIIELRLRFWVNSRVGRSIASPSTFRTDSQLIVFALRNVDNSEDAAVLALSGLASILRCALQYPASICFIDEAPILFEFDEISNMVGRLTANGAKSGIRVIICAQDPDTIANSAAGPKIIQNLTTRLIGRIAGAALPSFERIFGTPRSIIARNASKQFFPEKSGLYSKWLLDNNGTYTFCRYYPGEVQLAIVANNPDEQLLRTEVFAETPDNKLVAMVNFATRLTQKIRAS